MEVLQYISLHQRHNQPTFAFFPQHAFDGLCAGHFIRDDPLIMCEYFRAQAIDIRLRARRNRAIHIPREVRCVCVCVRVRKYN